MRDHQMPALRTIALVVIAAWVTSGHAAGLGPIRVQSALGQSLRASVPVVGADVSELTASCIRVRLEQPDGALMMAVQAAVARTGEAASIQLSTRQPVNEPAVTLNLQVACGASIQRSYQLLLDPVLILPQLSQESREGRAGGESDKSRLREQSMVAAAAEAAEPAPARRAAVRRQRSGEQAPSATQAAAPQPARKPAVQQDARTVTRNVLKLSSDDVAIDNGATFSPGLKLSDTLSESHDTGDAQSSAELKKAYGRFAAVLRDEDPLQNSEKQLRDMQAKLQELERQAAQLKAQGEQQRQADQAALANASYDAVSSRWVIALGGLLLAALAAIGWLYRRTREIGREQSAALWGKTVLGQPTAAGDWENTLGVDEDDAFAAPRSLDVILPKVKPSDWERGIPLDDTLAVDWASQQATMQAATLHALATRDASELDAAEESPSHPRSKARQDDGQFAWQAGHAPSPASQDAPPIVKAAQTAGQPPGKPAAPSSAGRAQQAAVKSNAGAQLMEVEEISDLMQEAEFWMLLNDSERAIEILEPCLHAGHPLSPVPWIYLLDLYRVTGQQENYQALAARIKKAFNTSAPAWMETDVEATGRSLRDYPHVVQVIENLWESDDVVPYLESLLLDEREGERAGFNLAVYREIIHLIGVARDPQTPRRREQLRFDDPQPRLISQKVSMPFAKAGTAAASLISEEEAEVFDMATSQQVTARQVTARQVTAKSAALKTAAADVTLPKAPVASVNPAEPQPEERIGTTDASPPPAAMPQTTQTIQTPVPVPAAESLHAAVAVPALEAAPTMSAAAAALAEFVPASTTADDAERVADMARKLDLVLAYQEIGENVGARVLLEEVIQGGLPLQVEKAKAMLKKLLKEIDWQ